MPAVFQSTYSSGFGNGNTASQTASVTVPAIPVGYTIIAVANFLTFGNVGATYGCADNGGSGGGVYISAGTPVIGNGTIGYDIAAFVCKSSVGNPTTVTITQTGGNAGSQPFAGISITVFSNVLSTTIIDGYVTNVQSSVGNGTDAITSGNFSPANAGDLIFGFGFGYQMNTGTGFSTALGWNVGNNSLHATEYKTSGSSGAQTTTFTGTGTPAATVVLALALQTLLLPTGDDMGLRILKTVDQWY